ncbi:MAG: hypothetical protein M0P01_13080 [Treponema sp.]|nr:hypothetical protein [Treponema sp.]
MPENRFSTLTWDTMLTMYPAAAVPSTDDYYRILSPDFPGFLSGYIELPLLQRLSGIGLLCGTDWTPLYRNRFYYSRLDHSIGVALIIWHFTHDKAQTLAGLLHDVSTPVFSHAADFRKGDALTQKSTEDGNIRMVQTDKSLFSRLAADGLTVDQVADYHRYPVADNEVPHLSADRLEYMFPSGMVLEGSWTLDDIADTYDDIVLCRSENGNPEPGFRTLHVAEEYCRRFCNTGHVLQLNENKLTLQMLGELINRAVSLGLLLENDCYTYSEADVIRMFDSYCGDSGFERLYRTFRTMTHVEHTDKPLPGYFCVSLKVKQRYINPLVVSGINKSGGLYEARRLGDVSSYAARIISDFLSYSDSPYGCVKLM